MFRKQLSRSRSHWGGILSVELVVTGVDGPVVFMRVVWADVPGVVDTPLEVPGVLEFVKGPDVAAEVGAVELPVDGGVVLEIAGVVPLGGVIALVVASVAGILHCVAGPMPVEGCFVPPGGITNTWPISSLSQS